MHPSSSARSVLPCCDSTSVCAAVIVLVGACGFPRPADVGGNIGDDVGNDAPAPDDASDLGLSIRVSPSGDDANDGLAAPVKTLKHALGLAAANSMVTRVVLASGTYAKTSGEIFPYTVPSNVTIVGPAGGGATLDGGGTDPGLIVENGGIQDLDLVSFGTAITATGVASFKNVRVLTSTTAIQAETAARLTVDNLSIAGTPGSCTTGIVLNGAAELTATTVMSRNLAQTLKAKDQSSAGLSKVNAAGDPACKNTVLMDVATSASFLLSDSLLDGGADYGLIIFTTDPSVQAVVSNTIIRKI